MSNGGVDIWLLDNGVGVDIDETEDINGSDGPIDEARDLCRDGIDKVEDDAVG